MNIIKSTRDIQHIQNERNILSLQIVAAGHQLDEWRNFQDSMVIFSHDTRHHLSLLSSYAEVGDLESLKIYLSEAQNAIASIMPQRYCENETVSLILSSFYTKAKKAGICFTVEAELPKSLSIPDTELCAVMSNGLENAIAAASLVEDGHKTVRVSCKLNRDKLLILIENSCMGKVSLTHGLPETHLEGHGFGMKSMVSIAEKRNGYCACESEDYFFTLRVVLPLDK